MLKRAWIAGAIIAVMGITAYGKTDSTSNTEAEAKTELKKLQSDINNVIDKNINLDNLNDKTPLIETKTANPLSELFRKFMNIMIALGNDYRHELAAVKIDTLLSPERIQHDKTFAQGKHMIKMSKTIIAKYKAKQLAAFDQINQEINQMDVADSIKQDFKAGFNQGLEKLKGPNGAIEKQWGFESKIIQEAEKLLAFLETNKKNWRVKQGQFQFLDNAKLKQYNQFIEDIQRITQEQRDFMKETQQKINTNFNKL